MAQQQDQNSLIIVHEDNAGISEACLSWKRGVQGPLEELEVWYGCVADSAESSLSVLVDTHSDCLRSAIFAQACTQGRVHGALVRPKYWQGDRSGTVTFPQLERLGMRHPTALQHFPMAGFTVSSSANVQVLPTEFGTISPRLLPTEYGWRKGPWQLIFADLQGVRSGPRNANRLEAGNGLPGARRCDSICGTYRSGISGAVFRHPDPPRNGGSHGPLGWRTPALRRLEVFVGIDPGSSAMADIQSANGETGAHKTGEHAQPFQHVVEKAQRHVLQWRLPYVAQLWDECPKLDLLLFCLASGAAGASDRRGTAVPWVCMHPVDVVPWSTQRELLLPVLKPQPPGANASPLAVLTVELVDAILSHIGRRCGEPRWRAACCLEPSDAADAALTAMGLVGCHAMRRTGRRVCTTINLQNFSSIKSKLD